MAQITTWCNIMGYDPIDTSETDNTADRKITIDEINGAEASVASTGELLSSDGLGNLQFIDPPSVGPVLNSATGVIFDHDEYYGQPNSTINKTVHDGAAAEIYGGFVNGSANSGFRYTFSDSTVLDVNFDLNDNIGVIWPSASFGRIEPISLPPAKDVIKLEVAFSWVNNNNSASSYGVYYKP